MSQLVWLNEAARERAHTIRIAIGDTTNESTAGGVPEGRHDGKNTTGDARQQHPLRAEVDHD